MVGGVRSDVRVCVWPAKANTIRSWRSASLSHSLSYYGQANGNETKAVSHKPSTYFLQLLKRIECLVRPRFQLLLLAPSPCPSLLCWLLTVVAAVVVALFSFVPDPSRFAWRRFARKKENKESREMTEADGRAAAAAYPGEAEYPCHRAYI